jgi:hypothetical protein
VTAASLNYTGRKRLNRRQFDVSHRTCIDEHDYLEIDVWVDPKILSEVEDSDAVVLDLVSRADHERFTLNRQETQTVRPSKFGPGSRPRCRIAIVDRDGSTPGMIKKSSSAFVLVPPPDNDDEQKDKFRAIKKLAEAKETFFEPEESDDIGALPWKVDFEDVGEVRILINSRLMALYDGDRKNPALRAMLLPAMAREVFTGILMRAESVSDIEGCESAKWFQWAEFIMDEDLPAEPFKGDIGIAVEWLDWLDRLMNEFSARRFDGQHTLLSKMEAYTND